MNYKSFKFGVGAFFQIGVSTISVALLLVSCGGGHNPGDANFLSPPAISAAVIGPDSFLLFPNPLSAPAIDSPTYAQAYYNAIDPLNERDTLDKWKAKNGFGNTSTGTEVSAVFGDIRDLGYGRVVTARWGKDDTWAFMVDNYSVWPTANYAYSSLNLDAAIIRDQRWYVGTNAIEISPGPGCTTTPIPNVDPKCKYITKFYNFNPTTGARQLATDLDGRGVKAMPGICLTCHGGRGDEILPASVDANTGNPVPALFPLFGNPASAVRGDVRAQLHFFEVDTFGFSTRPGFTRADQEAGLKKLNKWVLCTYPLPFGASAVAPEDQCRHVASDYEWQGNAADIIKAAYNNGVVPVAQSGIDGVPSPTYNDIYIPPAWLTAGQSTLYQNVVKPACRMCHMLRGVAKEDGISFSTFSGTGFQTFAGQIKDHVIDRGNMPLSSILYERFWSTPSMYNTIDEFLQASNPVAGSAVSYTVLDTTGAPLKPGRPVALAGPDRTVGTLSTKLSAAQSLFADTYAWSIVSDPVGTATLSSATGLETTFNALTDGTYVVRLIASKGSVQSDPVNLKLVVKSSTWPLYIYPSSSVSAISNPLPSAIRFSDIKHVLQEVSPTTGKATACTQCHQAKPSTTASLLPPILYTDIDRNDDLVVQSGVNGTDDKLFYYQVLSFVNFSDVANSALLLHPAGYNHAGGVQGGFGIGGGQGGVGISADQYVPGDSNRGAYDMFLNWILNGAPY